MADWTISSGDYIKPYRSPWGQLEVGFMPESTTQAWVYGDILCQDPANSTTANLLAKASTTGSTIASTSIVGVAAEAASGVQYTTKPYFTVNPNNEFTARTRGGVLGSTTVNEYFGLFRDSSKNVTLIDFGNKQSTSVKVVVTKLIDAVGDSGGLVAFRFKMPAGSTCTFGGGY